VQLLVCDWLLATRTEAWQHSCAVVAKTCSGDHDEGAPASTTVFADELVAFQQDLSSLRRLAHHWRPAMSKVSSVFALCRRGTVWPEISIRSAL